MSRMTPVAFRVYTEDMKSSLLGSESVPYLLSGASVFAGVVIRVFGHLTAEPVTRDPNIGADLVQLLGTLMIIGGIVGGLLVFITRKVKRIKVK